LRLLFLMVAVVLLGTAVYQIVSHPEWIRYVDIPPVKSRGMIAALKGSDSGGTHVVILTREGVVRELPATEATDHDVLWDPQGKRILFLSNRTRDGSFQVFEWKPDRNNEPVQITPDGASRSRLWISANGKFLLVTTRGEVFQIEYPRRFFRRVFPPSNQPDPFAGAEQELRALHTHTTAEDLILERWRQLQEAIEGEAFTEGFVDASGTYFAGVYKIALGYAVVLHHLQTTEVPPLAPWGGKNIEITYHPQRPEIIVALQDFQFPHRAQVPRELIQPDGSVKRPFVHALLWGSLPDILAGNSVGSAIFASQSGEEAWTQPIFAPDGERFAVIHLKKQKDKWVREGLYVVNLSPQGVTSVVQVAEGEVYDPAWSPDSQRLAFVRNGDVFVVERTGGGEENLTKGSGSFHSPVFSPQGWP
jgi:dipeptidyl aminopeptidase/acylaminoacyl peptidase